MTRPYELLIRFAKNGTIAGASVRYLETVNGRDYELDPVPLVDVADDPAFTAFAASFAAAAAREAMELREEVRELRPVRDERDSLLLEHETRFNELQQVKAERDQLQRRIVEIEQASSLVDPELKPEERIK